MYGQTSLIRFWVFLMYRDWFHIIIQNTETDFSISCACFWWLTMYLLFKCVSPIQALLSVWSDLLYFFSRNEAEVRLWRGSTGPWKPAGWRRSRAGLALPLWPFPVWRQLPLQVPPQLERTEAGEAGGQARLGTLAEDCFEKSSSETRTDIFIVTWDIFFGPPRFTTRKDLSVATDSWTCQCPRTPRRTGRWWLRAGGLSAGVSHLSLVSVLCHFYVKPWLKGLVLLFSFLFFSMPLPLHRIQAACVVLLAVFLFPQAPLIGLCLKCQYETKTAGVTLNEVSVNGSSSRQKNKTNKNPQFRCGCAIV